MSTAQLLVPNPNDLFCQTLTCENLNVTGEFVSTTLVASGAIVNPSIAVDIQKIGRQVTLRLDATISALTVANAFIDLTGIAAVYYPIFEVFFPCYVTVNSSNAIAGVSVSAAGLIRIYANTSQGQYPDATVNCGWANDIVITYLTV